MVINKKDFKLIQFSKTVIVSTIVLFFLFSCDDITTKNKNLINIYFNNFETEIETDISSTPYYNIKMSVENVENVENLNFFCAKSYQHDDSTYSRLYLLDTIKNHIIPIYSNSRILINRGKVYDIFARIDLFENKLFFDLRDDFFLNKKYDIKYLNEQFLKLINHSIIIYKQDYKDKKSFIFNQENPSLIEQNILIEIQKQELISMKNYGIKQKKLRIVNGGNVPRK